MARGSSRAQSEEGDEVARAQRGAKYKMEAIEKLLSKGKLDEDFVADIRADAEKLVAQLKPGAKLGDILNKLTDLRDEVTDELEALDVRAKVASRTPKAPKEPKDLKLDVVVNKGEGPVTPEKAAERLKALSNVTLHGELEAEDPRVDVNDVSTSRYWTMDDSRRHFLRDNPGNRKLLESPYASRVLDMTKEDVRAALANKEVKKYVMQRAAADYNANLVNRDKDGNWFASERVSGNRYMRSHAEMSDYDLLARTMLRHPEVAERVFQLIDNR